MSKIRRTRSRVITVYHGAKHWALGSPIRARSIEYMIGRGMSVDDAFTHARGQLEYLNDFSNKSLLEKVMLNAQRSGLLSPFVSTSRSRDVARSFALYGGPPGFILTIEGPESAFYDFNAIRERHGIPHPSEFEWLEELGIPLQIDAPFRIVDAEEVHEVVERKRSILRRRKK